jgi:hypothetical protein
MLKINVQLKMKNLISKYLFHSSTIKQFSLYVSMLEIVSSSITLHVTEFVYSYLMVSFNCVITIATHVKIF